MSAVDELAVSDGWPGGRSAEQEIGQIGDASAAIEAVVPLARIARQMLGADAVEGAVEPGLHIAEQDQPSASARDAFLLRPADAISVRR